MRRIVTGLALVGLSVLLAMATLLGWLNNLEANPAAAWVMFGAGFLMVSGLALLGVWTVLHAIKIDRDEVDKKGSNVWH